MTNGVSNALEGLKRSTTRLSESASTIASGNVGPESIVDLKINEADVRIQAKNVSVQVDKDKEILDLLA